MIRHQDSRRNWNQSERAYVLGKEYEVRKKIAGRPNKEEPIRDQNDPVSEAVPERTAERIAKEQNTSAPTVKRAARFAKAVDKIGVANPEAKAAILNGTSKATKADVIAAGDKRCAKCQRIFRNNPEKSVEGCQQCAEAAATSLKRKRPAKDKPEPRWCVHCGGTGLAAD